MKKAYLKSLLIFFLLVVIAAALYVVKSELCIDIIPHRHLLIFKE